MREIGAKVLVNAAGPWVAELTAGPPRPAARRAGPARQGQPHRRAESSSTHDRAYIFQNADGRIVFAIPYERDFTLIGTTDLDYDGDPGEASRHGGGDRLSLRGGVASISAAGSRRRDVVWTYAGVRPLYDDGVSEAQAATRDYVLKVEGGGDVPPVLNIYGGKITTYRRLAEAALEKLAPFFDKLGNPWTATARAAGRRFPGRWLRRRSSPRSERAAARLPAALAPAARARLRHARPHDRRRHAASETDWGETFGADLTEREVRYLMQHEWARTAEDVLWRRSKLGLRLSAAEARRLDDWMQAAGAAGARAGGDGGRRRACDARAPPRDEARAQRDAHRRRVAHLRARHAEHPARADALRQDQPDAADGGARQPTEGSVFFDGKDVTGVPVRERSVAMVYQQFINYPNLTRLREHRLAAARRRREEGRPRPARARDGGADEAHAAARAQAAGALRRPAAAHRARARHRQAGADLVLLDEPLANLDYKLREELREELPRIFSATGAIFVYATTEPVEALLLGGSTATLAQGRVTQFGPTVEVYRRPNSLETARIFSDPPINTLAVKKSGASISSAAGHLKLPAVGAARRASRRQPTRSASARTTVYLRKARPGRDRRQRAAWRSPRSPARRASSTSISPASAGWRWRMACTTSRSASRSSIYLDPGPLLRLRRLRRARCRARRAAGGIGGAMARIVLDGVGPFLLLRSARARRTTR